MRARVDVTRVLIRSRQGDETDLIACEPGVIDGLRFYVGFAWPNPSSQGFGLDKVRAFDGDGHQVDTCDLSFWDGMGRPDSRGTRSVSPTRLLSSRLADLLLERRIE